MRKATEARFDLVNSLVSSMYYTSSPASLAYTKKRDRRSVEVQHLYSSKSKPRSLKKRKEDKKKKSAGNEGKGYDRKNEDDVGTRQYVRVCITCYNVLPQKKKNVVHE